MKHKHAELIKAWADGAEIEFFNGEDWFYDRYPSWHNDYQYRIKRPAWQQKLIDAAKEGKEVQVSCGGVWQKSILNDQLDNYQFLYYEEAGYRIKNKLTDEQLAFRRSVGNIAIDEALVDEYFATGDKFWDSRPDEDLIRIHDTYLVWRDAIAYTKQLKDKP